MKTFKIGKNDIGIRLDNFLSKVFPQLKKHFIFKCIRTNLVKVNNKKAAFNYRLNENDIVIVKLNIDTKKTNLKSTFLWQHANKTLNIVYEDKNLLIIDKPAHLIVDDYSKQKNDTLLNRVKNYLFLTKQWDPKKENQFEPCLLHRLDTNTRGLIMAAKNHEIADFINEKIKKHEIDKYYQCMVYGKMPYKHQVLHAYWYKDPSKPFVSISNFKRNLNYLPISTEYKLIFYDRKNDLSFLEIKLITGKTHQIRAHMHFIGHPIVGERKYISEKYKKWKKCFKFQQLIASKIIFNFKSSKNSRFNYLNNKIIKLKIQNLC